MNLEDYIRDIENFPIDGVIFKDISPLLSSPEAFEYTIDQLATNMSGVDCIVGLDARGFIFGGALAYKLNIPFIPIRKSGKLPSKTISLDYELEYGKNTFEIHSDSISKGNKVAIIDDLLATGGTAYAATQLVEQLGGIVDSINFVINLEFLEGYKKIDKYTINSLLTY